MKVCTGATAVKSLSRDNGGLSTKICYGAGTVTTATVSSVRHT